jgi:hypothetical protein
MTGIAAFKKFPATGLSQADRPADELVPGEHLLAIRRMRKPDRLNAIK